MQRFVILQTPDHSYWVNPLDINYVICDNDINQDIVINCHRIDIRIPPDHYSLMTDTELLMPTILNNGSKTINHDRPGYWRYENTPIIKNLVLSWITTTTDSGIIYINPDQISVITKHNGYNIRFKSTAGLTCDKLDGKNYL